MTRLKSGLTSPVGVWPGDREIRTQGQNPQGAHTHRDIYSERLHAGLGLHKRLGAALGVGACAARARCSVGWEGVGTTLTGSGSGFLEI